MDVILLLLMLFNLRTFAQSITKKMSENGMIKKLNCCALNGSYAGLKIFLNQKLKRDFVFQHFSLQMVIFCVQHSVNIFEPFNNGLKADKRTSGQNTTF